MGITTIPIKELTKHINIMLKGQREGISIAQIEKETGNSSLHKLNGFIKVYYVKQLYQNIPLKITTAEMDVIKGEYQKYNLKYRRIMKARKKGQTKIDKYYKKR